MNYQDKEISPVDLYRILENFLERKLNGNVIIKAIQGNELALELVNGDETMRGLMNHMLNLKEQGAQINQELRREKTNAPYVGMYSYTVNDGSELNGYFETPRNAIIAAIQDINKTWYAPGEPCFLQPKIEFTIGEVAHPFDVAYGGNQRLKLGIDIATNISDNCRFALGSPKSVLELKVGTGLQDYSTEMADSVLNIARKNMAVVDYGLSHEVVFCHTVGESPSEQINHQEAEFLARKAGWEQLEGQVFRVDGRSKNIEHAGSWIEAVNIDKGCSVNEEDGASPGLS